MRTDLVLKYLCVVKSRSQVRALCERGAVSIGQREAKPSTVLHANDRISIELPSKILVISLVTVPERQLSKAEAPAYYEIVEERARDPW